MNTGTEPGCWATHDLELSNKATMSVFLTSGLGKLLIWQYGSDLPNHKKARRAAALLKRISVLQTLHAALTNLSLGLMFCNCSRKSSYFSSRLPHRIWRYTTVTRK